jgi:cob(I)alamin adenosyltransferase
MSLSKPMSGEDELGMIHVYTGDGKGKTTASIGLGLRATGHGYRVLMIQFMKGQINYGELEAVKNLPNFDIVQFGRADFVDKKNPAEIDVKLARDGLEFTRKAMNERKYDVLILDEINVAVEWNLIGVKDVCDLLESKPDHMEIILTGRHAPQSFIDIADTVTEMKEVKHPFTKGVLARKGIEH